MLGVNAKLNLNFMKFNGNPGLQQNRGFGAARILNFLVVNKLIFRFEL